MDPLSLSASVIAISTLATQTCSALSNLRSLCENLPGRLHAVNNEVADLNLVLFQVSLLIQDRASLPETKASAIPHLLKQANIKLVEIKDIVWNLTVACGTSRLPIFRAHAWRTEQSRLQSLQDDVRAVKANLNIMLGASNSQDMTKIRLDIESISAVTLQSSQQQNVFKDNFLSALAAVDRRIARVEEMLRDQADRVQASQFKQVGSSYEMSTVPRQRPSNHRNGTYQEGMSVRVRPFMLRCRSGCPCSCHFQPKTTRPTLFNRVLGQLFVGYAGLPLFGSRCNSEACEKSRASQIALEYWFPMGFLSSTIARLQVGYQPDIGPFVQLDTLRRVPDSAQCVNFALNGDIEGLKHLFNNGLASPRDVSTSRGYSLLRWALYGKQYETCEFLLYAGADADYRPIATSDNSPRNKACHFLLEGGLSDAAVGALSAITRGGHLEDFIGEARFTKLHKIAVGLSLLSLEDQIFQSPDEINAVDAMGRTPLAWAAARGDTRAIVTLLGHGADPNITDIQLSGPLSNAAAQGHTVCVRLLLEAGAQTDFSKPGQERKGSPLNCAARNTTDILLLKSLLDFGADVDASGTDGKTSLHHAARTDNASFAMLLLEYGAHINAMAADGSTPLTAAITYNSHNVLRLILDRWHEYSVCPRLKGPNLLQIAALYADTETLRILAATDHLRMKYDKHYTIGDFKNRLQQRRNLTNSLSWAFDDLLNVINRVPDLRTYSTEELQLCRNVSCCLTSTTPHFEDASEPGSGCSSDGSFLDALENLPGDK